MSDMPPPSRPLPSSSMGDLPGQIGGTGFRPLGGSPLPEGPAMLQTLNGIVTNMQTVVMETQKIAKDVTGSSERAARMFGDAFDKAAMAGLGARGATWEAWTASGMIGLPNVPTPSITPTPAGRGGAGHGGGGGSEPIPAQDIEAHRRAATALGMGEGPRRHFGPPPPPGFNLPGSWDEGREFSLGKLRQQVARGVNRSVSQWGSTSQQQLRDQYGRFAGFRPAPAGAQPEVSVIRKYDAAGNLVRDEAGKGIIESVGSGGWKYESTAMARNFAGSLAEGEGLGSALSSAAPAVGTALGAAGAVYVGANKALDFAETQRQKNLEFQSVLGGSNAEGFSERMRQNVFRLGLRGTMGGGDAEAIYKAGMENYGTNRAARNDYQTAAVRMYGGGIGSSESIALLDQAAKRGNDNVRLLAESVLALGQVARSAGESAESAREKFSQSMETYSTMSSGTQQIQAASLEAAVQTNLGDRLGSVTYSGQNSRTGQYRMADMLGVSQTDLSAALNSGSVRLNIGGRQVSGVQALAMGKDQMMSRAISSLDPAQQIQNAIRAKAKALGYAEHDYMDPGVAEEIAAQVQQELPDDLTSPMRVGGILRSVGGADVTDNDAMTMLTRQILTPGLNELTLGNVNAVPDPAGKGFKGLDGWTKDNMKDPDNLGKRGRAAYNFIEEELGYSLAKGAIRQDFREGDIDTGKGRPGARRSAEDQFRNRLVKNISEGKGVDANLYALYKNKDDLADSRFVVKTKGGKKTSVEFGELANYYGDQVAANPESIQIQGGRYGGQDLYQAFGIQSDGTKATSDNQGAKAGVSVEEGKKRTKDKEKSTGSVEIFLTDEARRLIGINTSGSAQEARAAGVQPPSNASTPSETRGN